MHLNHPSLLHCTSSWSKLHSPHKARINAYTHGKEGQGRDVKMWTIIRINHTCMLDTHRVQGWKLWLVLFHLKMIKIIHLHQVKNVPHLKTLICMVMVPTWLQLLLISIWTLELFTWKFLYLSRWVKGGDSCLYWACHGSLSHDNSFYFMWNIQETNMNHHKSKALIFSWFSR